MRTATLLALLPALSTIQLLACLSFVHAELSRSASSHSSTLLHSRSAHKRRSLLGGHGSNSKVLTRDHIHTGDDDTKALDTTVYPASTNYTSAGQRKTGSIQDQVRASVGITEDDCDDDDKFVRPTQELSYGNGQTSVPKAPTSDDKTIYTDKSVMLDTKAQSMSDDSKHDSQQANEHSATQAHHKPGDKESPRPHHKANDNYDDDDDKDIKADESGDDDKGTQGNSSTKSHEHAHPSSGGDHLKGHFKGKCTDPQSSDKRPNGDISFLNCGIDDDGWTPPHVTPEMLIMAEAGNACDGQFKPCRPYLGHFKRASQVTGVPTTLLLAIAMQESHCNAHLHGPNGEIGMLQLVEENCKGDCWDVENNIELGARLFDHYVKQNKGNVLAGIGCYNGWHRGMTKSQAMSTKYGCEAQNNLDYIDQMVNGWLQGKDGYSKEFQTYNNLGRCH